jgi:hypothetical protein
MKMLTKVSIYLAMVAMCLMVTLAGPADAKSKIRFSGFFQGQEIDVQPPGTTTLLVNGSGTGLATHLGEFTMTYNVTVNLVEGSGIGSAHLTAANGDSIFTQIRGQAEPTETPGINSIEEVNTITGGTGQFAGATGSFTVERLLNLPTGFTSGSLSGKITVRD